MKQSKLALFLLAFVIMLTALSAVTPGLKSQKAIKQVSYYWFDASTNWLGRQNTVAAEISLTGYDEGTSNPKTLQEKGYTSGHVSFDQWGTPSPNVPSPDKALYSHP